MAVIKMEEFQEYPTLPPETILLTKVAEVRTKDVNGKTEGSGWTKLEFKFKILGIQVTGDGSPVEAYENLIGQHIWGSVPFRFTDSAENRLKQWCEAIFGMELKLGFELDTELLENKTVRAITGVYDKRATNPRTGKPFQNHQVESLLPAGGQIPPPQYTAPAADPWGTQQAPAAAAGPLFAAPAQQATLAPPAPQPQADPWGSQPADPGGWGSPDDEPPF